ncbi:MAG: heme o synthase [Candidatus Kapabacteria bacterium]|nr:heme o synthase [Candidatus Kapabacteria bacterium]
MAMHDTDAVAMNVDLPMEKETSVLRHYYELTKPGISQMVAMSTLAGYYLAIPGDVTSYAAIGSNWVHFLSTMVGTLAISSGSCVVNHIMEKDADARMKRTSTRPIPAGIISVREAMIFAGVLTLVGAALLATINVLTFLLAIGTWLSYVAVYTPLKRKSSLAVIIGGVPGALPFAGGWTAVRGSMDPMAWSLFAILFFWQLPHFYALSWMYRSDYRAGGFVLRAISDDSGKTLGMQMTVTSVLTLASLVVPTMLGSTGWLYLVGSIVLGLWLTAESALFVRKADASAARRVLLTSYAVLMGVILLMFLDKQ